MIDTTWYLVTSEWFESIWIGKGIQPLIRKNEKFAYLNNSGEIVTGFYEVTDESLVAVIIDKEGNMKWGFINTNLEMIIPCEYDSVESFKDGKAKVTKGEDTFWINKKGERVEGE